MSSRPYLQFVDPAAEEALALVAAETEPEDWRARALCAEVDGDLWFPTKGGSVKEPKRICRVCPVQEPCLEYALENDIHHGLWGGLSPEERWWLKRGAKAA